MRTATLSNRRVALLTGAAAGGSIELVNFFCSNWLEQETRAKKETISTRRIVTKTRWQIYL